MPDKFLTVEDRLADRINPALVLWRKQYKLLMSWILSSLGDQMQLSLLVVFTRMKSGLQFRLTLARI